MKNDLENVIRMHPDIAGKLIRDLYQHFSINEIIDSMYSLIGNPVMVAFSHKRQSMYYSCGESIEYEFTISDDEIKRREQAMGNTDFRQEIAKKLKALEPVIIDNGDYFSGRRRILATVTDGADSIHPVGTIAVFEAERAFTETDFVIIRLFAEAISEKCSSQTFRATLMHTPYEQNIQNLIQGKAIEKDRKWVKEVFGSSPYSFCVSICDVKKKDRYEIEELQREFAWKADADISILRGSYLVLINNIRNKDPKRIKDGMSAIAKSEELIVGSSDLFQDIKDMKKYYAQAKSVLRYAGDMLVDKGAYDFAGLQVETFIHKAAESMNTDEFESGRIRRLIEYDEKNGGTYYDTFLSYIRNGMDNEKTRNDLHVHRNTLLYRLGKIREITMIPDNDDSALFRLYLEDLLRREMELRKN